MQKIKIREDLIIQRRKNRVVIYEGKESVLLTLNEIGTIIFEKLKKGWSKGEIVDFLIQKYDATKSAIEVDFDDFLKQLKVKKVIL